MPPSTQRSPSRAGLFLAASLLAACSSGLSRPRMGQAPPDAFAEVVPYPPPAARVEIVPPRKDAREVWIDGQWAWSESTWRWVPGGWVTPPPGPGVYFTPWSLLRAADGTLYFARATWRTADGRALGFGHGVCAP